MQIKVPQLSVRQAGLQTISIGQLGIGPISVGSLALNNIGFTFNAAHAVLQNVQVTLTLRISLEWHVHIGLPDGIPDINVGDTFVFTMSFSLPVGTITIPGLGNLRFDIPSLTAQNLAVSASPLALQLNNVAADAIHATDVALPEDGFTISGLSFGSLAGSGIGVPAATVGQATVQHVHGDPAKIPAFSLGNLQLPAAQIPSVDSTIPLTIPLDLEGAAAGFDAGILRVTLRISPSVTTRVQNLQITGASASAAVGQIVLHDVTLPYDALNLTLSQIGVDTIDIPNFTIG
jgi:hypothetical protein